MLKHSKLPWDVHFDTTDNWCIVTDNFTVAHDNICDTQLNTKVSKANGQFIIKACNNHYELLKALKLAVHALNRKPNFPFNCSDKNIKNSYAIASICDKAIAKAESED